MNCSFYILGTYLSSIFSKILHTKSYTTYQKFSSYLVSFQKIYLCFFLLLSGPIQIGTPHLETVIQGPCPVHGWCQRYNLAVRGAWWLYVAFIINFDHSNSLSGLCSYRYAFEISHQCANFISEFKYQIVIWRAPILPGGARQYDMMICISLLRTAANQAFWYLLHNTTTTLLKNLDNFFWKKSVVI